ncbi:MAG: hypothetical protein HKN46_05890 [Acidimicrobiia bacterium]|nr:hypothetical protein [Acidimicrobiia bacterium]
MRLTELLAPEERVAIERLVPGVDLDAVLLAPLPDAVVGAVPALGAITLGRRVLIRADILDGDRDVLLDLLAHEVVHVAQWRRLGPLGFLVRYLVDYGRLRLGGLGHTDAYLRIPAEEEARKLASRRVGLRPE